MKKHKSLKSAMKAAKETHTPQTVSPEKAISETKVNISIRLDLEVLNWLKTEAEKSGLPYQTLANSILKKASAEPSLEERIRRIEAAVFDGKGHKS